MKIKVNKNEYLVQMESMPFDRNGMHCTGYAKTFDGGKTFYFEYENPETGEKEYLR